MKKAISTIILCTLVIFANIAGGVCFFPEIAISGIHVAGARDNMTAGDSIQLEVTFEYYLPLPTKGMELIFSSSSPDVVTIDEQGKVTAVTEGEATIAVVTEDKKHKFLQKIKVVWADQLVSDSDVYVIGVGENIPVTITAGDGSSPDFEFVSKNPEIAEINQSGMLTAMAIGWTSVTVHAQGYQPVDFEVAVLAAPEKIIPAKQSFTMGLGEVWRVPFLIGEDEACSTFTYKSSDEKVIKVLEDGSIEGVTRGRAEIIATSYNGKTAKVPVTVGGEPTAVSITEKTKTAYVSDTPVVFTVNVKGWCQSFTWQTEDPSIAYVDEQGNVICKGKGSTTVSCTTYNGKQTTATIHVKAVDYSNPYHSDRVYKSIIALAEAYPDLITAESIGKSVNGKDMMMMKVGTGSRKVLIGAEMHASENVTVNFTLRCIESYADNYYDSGKYGKYDIKKLLDTFTMYIVPMINPDGLDIVNADEMPLWTGGEEPEDPDNGRPWREDYKSNANGVNLNGNFPFRWDEVAGRKSDPSLDGGVGPEAMSEPETAALVELCRANEFEWMFSMHCRWNEIFYRDDYNGEVPGDKDLATRIAKVAGMKLRPVSSKKYLAGGFENWFRYEFKRPGFCIELVPLEMTRFVGKGDFDTITVWSKTKFIFIEGLQYLADGSGK